jgi:hypothetical protein
MQDVFVIDNIVSKCYQDYLEDYFVRQAGMFWVLTEDLNSRSFPIFRNGINCFADISDHEERTYGFVRQPITSGRESDPILGMLLRNFAFACSEKTGFSFADIINARAFLQMPWNAPEQNKFHVDLKEPHMVLLYYVNDSDGDTMLSSKRYSGEEQYYGVDSEVAERISPKKGRAIFFDGSVYHAASVPKKNLRCILNFNLV